MRFWPWFYWYYWNIKVIYNEVTAMAHKWWHFCSCSYFIIILLKIASEQTTGNKLALDCVYHIIVHEMLSRILWILDQTWKLHLSILLPPAHGDTEQMPQMSWSTVHCFDLPTKIFFILLLLLLLFCGRLTRRRHFVITIRNVHVYLHIDCI